MSYAKKKLEESKPIQERITISLSADERGILYTLIRTHINVYGDKDKKLEPLSRKIMPELFRK